MRLAAKIAFIAETRGAGRDGVIAAFAEPGAVSGGELQRLSLLRVLLRRPAFVFADEPTSRLDPITQARVIALLIETAAQDGVALMLVSHDRALIRNTADTVLPLEAPDEGAVPGPARAVAPVLQ